MIQLAATSIPAELCCEVCGSGQFHVVQTLEESPVCTVFACGICLRKEIAGGDRFEAFLYIACEAEQSSYTSSAELLINVLS